MELDILCAEVEDFSVIRDGNVLKLRIVGDFRFKAKFRIVTPMLSCSAQLLEPVHINEVTLEVVVGFGYVILNGIELDFEFGNLSFVHLIQKFMDDVEGVRISML